MNEHRHAPVHTVRVSATATTSVLHTAHPRHSKCTTTESEVEASSGEAVSSWPGADDTTSAGDATVAKVVGEARLPGVAKQSATTAADIAVSSGEAGPSWSRANGNSAAASAAEKSAGEARPSRIVKYSVTSESELDFAESSDEESSTVDCPAALG